jgi:hypothetical protein
MQISIIDNPDRPTKLINIRNPPKLTDKRYHTIEYRMHPVKIPSAVLDTDCKDICREPLKSAEISKATIKMQISIIDNPDRPTKLINIR